MYFGKEERYLKAVEAVEKSRDAESLEEVLEEIDDLFKNDGILPSQFVAFGIIAREWSENES